MLCLSPYCVNIGVDFVHRLERVGNKIIGRAVVNGVGLIQEDSPERVVDESVLRLRGARVVELPHEGRERGLQVGTNVEGSDEVRLEQQQREQELYHEVTLFNALEFEFSALSLSTYSILALLLFFNHELVWGGGGERQQTSARQVGITQEVYRYR